MIEEISQGSITSVTCRPRDEALDDPSTATYSAVVRVGNAASTNDWEWALRNVSANSQEVAHCVWPQSSGLLYVDDLDIELTVDPGSPSSASLEVANHTVAITDGPSYQRIRKIEIQALINKYGPGGNDNGLTMAWKIVNVTLVDSGDVGTTYTYIPGGSSSCEPPVAKNPSLTKLARSGDPSATAVKNGLVLEVPSASNIVRAVITGKVLLQSTDSSKGYPPALRPDQIKGSIFVWTE